MRFPEPCLVRLQSAGLIVEGRFEGDERNPVDFSVVKPSNASGNWLPGYSFEWDEGISTDVPPLRVRSLKDYWILRNLSLWAPGPGPEDFQHRHNDPDSVVDDIITYLFGKSEFIEAGRQYYQERLTRWQK